MQLHVIDMQDQQGEGCHMWGTLSVNKVSLLPAKPVTIGLTQHCCRIVVLCAFDLADSACSEQVAGNFHFAPGKSFQQGNMHVHDLVPFPTKKFDMSHHINKLSFGKVGFVLPSGVAVVTSSIFQHAI
jgi:Endoplasmic reticulum vesicle transporter